jgi:acetyl esterase
VYLFGGGWTLGTLDTSDAICRALTYGTGCLTVSFGTGWPPSTGSRPR